MLQDGLILADGSAAENFQIQSGSSLPTEGLNSGELFYVNTGPLKGLHIYDGSAWQVSGGSGPTGPAAAGTLTGSTLASNVTSSSLTTVGSLTSLSVSGAASVGSLTSTGAASAASFSGSGSALTALNANNLSSGTVGTARLGSGTANSTTYLRGDQTWVTVEAGGGAFTGGTVANPTTFSSSVSFDSQQTTGRTNLSASSTTNFDASLGNVFNVSLVSGITSITFTNVPASGRVYSLMLFLTQDGTGNRTIQWPNSVKWPNGLSPSLTPTPLKTDVVTLVTFDGGTTWFGFTSGLNF